MERPYSVQFNEHYWSGGPAEKTHVFLHGNNLPARFAAAQGTFIITELGFGTGLNFALATRLWHQVAPPRAELVYISYEAYCLPLPEIAAICRSLAAQLPEIELIPPAVAASCRAPAPIPVTPAITLHLRHTEAIKGLESQQEITDAWFLDGFSPARNPEMWTPEIFSHIRRLSAKNTTAATYSAAKIVREGLQNAGFSITKTAGYPPKRDMLTAVKTS